MCTIFDHRILVKASRRDDGGGGGGNNKNKRRNGMSSITAGKAAPIFAWPSGTALKQVWSQTGLVANRFVYFRLFREPIAADPSKPAHEGQYFQASENDGGMVPK